jgi:hypothetical protein
MYMLEAKGGGFFAFGVSVFSWAQHEIKAQDQHVCYCLSFAPYNILVSIRI